MTTSAELNDHRAMEAEGERTPMQAGSLSDDIFSMGLAMNRAFAAGIESTTRFPGAPVREAELTREELCDLAEVAQRSSLQWHNLKEQDATTRAENQRWAALSAKLSGMARARR